jgi:hypothetical protein
LEKSNILKDINVPYNIYYNSEIFPDAYLSIYKKWYLRGTSEGYRGTGAIS